MIECCWSLDLLCLSITSACVFFLYVSIYNIRSTYVCFISWVSCYIVMRKLSLTFLVYEMTNYNEVDDSQYNFYICLWFFQILKIKYFSMKCFKRPNGNFIQLTTLILGCFVVDLKIRWKIMKHRMVILFDWQL